VAGLRSFAKADRSRKHRSPLHGISPLGAIAGSFLALLVIAAVLAPLIAPYSPTGNDLSATYQKPGLHHLLGTDEFGRDLLSRIIYGGRISLTGVGVAVVVYLILGATIGVVAGYVGGILDSVVTWVAEVCFALPGAVVILVLLATLGNNVTAAMLVLGLLAAPSLAVFMSGATKSVRAEMYIAAARVTGLRTRQILMRHVLPQVLAPLTVQLSLFAGTALLVQTGLDFLGLATQPPTASWGAMVSDGATHLGQDGWMVVPPGVVVMLSVMSFGLLGDALQDRRRERLKTPTPVNARPGGVPIAADDTDCRAASTTLDPQVVLTVRQLSVGTNDGGYTPIVDNVTFELRHGACIGIVGESGSGKTMTALSVIGLLPDGVAISAGTVTFAGRELVGSQRNDSAGVRGAGIAMISQEPVANLDPSFTVGAQVAEVVRRHSRASRRQAYAEALDLLTQVRLPNVKQIAKRYPHQLSGGMAQRVVIAAALAGKPQVLIADEPTTALDVTVQAEILELLRDLRAETGLAMILVSHDWGIIADSCDSALVMYAGQLVEESPIAEIFDRPRHPYSEGLMRSNPYYAPPSRSKLPSIPGNVPALGQWPLGCRFAARCQYATEDCRATSIELVRIDSDRWARCIHHDLVAAPQAGLAS